MRATICVAAFAFVGASAATVQVGASAQPSALRPTYAYATNGGTVTPIDTATNKRGTPITAGANTDGIAITPDGATIYAANYFAGTVTPIDTATATAGPDITVGGGAIGVAVTPDGATAYVVLYKDNAIVPIDTATNSVGTPIPTGGAAPKGIAITPDGATAYVTNTDSDTVTPIDLASQTAATPIAVGDQPGGIAMAPNGRTAYVVDYSTLGTGATVERIDTATNTLLAGITYGGGLSPGPGNIAITADGTTAYVARWGNNDLVPIDLVHRTVGTPIALSPYPFAVAITPNGASAYVARETHPGHVVPIDLATGLASHGIRIDGFGNGVSITPDQAPIAKFAVDAAAAGNPTSFDASTSIAITSAIAKYHWKFGDGTTADTTTPFTTHTYSTPGTYRVVLVLTDAAGTSTKQVFTGQTMVRNGSRAAHAAHKVRISE